MTLGESKFGWRGSSRSRMVLPLLKLGTLTLRTLSKPVAKNLKQHAANYPKFRQFIVALAQANHQISTKMQRKLYGRAEDVFIPPLNQERAVQVAADLIGECFLFMVAGAALVYEVNRNSKAEARKEEARKQQLLALKNRNAGLSEAVSLLRKRLEEVEKLAKEQGLADCYSLANVIARALNFGTPISSNSCY